MNSENAMEECERLCRLLNTDYETSAEAKKLLGDFLENPAVSFNGQQDPKHWAACAIYVASHQRKSQGCTSLSSVLRVLELSLYDFFQPLQAFVTTLGLDATLLSTLKTKYVVLNLFFASYTSLFEKHFKQPEGNIDHPSQKIFRFGWSLFLVGKTKLEDRLDFVACFHLQLCCFNFLLYSIPSELRLVPLPKLLATIEQDSPDLEEITPSKETQSLQYVCQFNKANFQEVQKMANTLFYPLLHELTTVPAHSPTLKTDVRRSSQATLSFNGVLDTHLSFNEKSIHHLCDLLNSDQCDFNERLFLEVDNQLLSPKRQQEISHIHKKAKLTPQKHKSASAWLEECILHVSTTPNPELQAYFKQGDEDLSLSIQSSLRNWLDIVSFLREDLTVQASKFFYRLLLNVLKSEEKRLSQAEFAKRHKSILHEPFLRPLFAVCLDVVLLVHFYICPYNFPWTINKLSVNAFDYPRVIEALVKLEPSLPPKILRELTKIERRILQEIGWDSQAPVFFANEQQKDSLNRRLALAGSPDHITEHVHVAFSGAATDPSMISNSPAIDFFFRKCIHYGCSRMISLWNVLHDSLLPEIKIEVLLQGEYVLTDLLIHKLEIFKNRHMDQIILCIVYALCKIHHPDKIPFQALVLKYLSLPNSQHQVILDVLLGANDIRGDIIAFYNQVFILQFELDSLLWKFEHGTVGPNLNASSSSSTWQPSTPKIKNFFLTPLRGSQNSTPSKSVTSEKVTLNSDKSPAKCFHRINSSMSKVRKELFPSNTFNEIPVPEPTSSISLQDPCSSLDFSNITAPFTPSNLAGSPFRGGRPSVFSVPQKTASVVPPPAPVPTDTRPPEPTRQVPPAKFGPGFGYPLTPTQPPVPMNVPVGFNPTFPTFPQPPFGHFNSQISPFPFPSFPYSIQNPTLNRIPKDTRVPTRVGQPPQPSTTGLPQAAIQPGEQVPKVEPSPSEPLSTSMN